MHHQNQELLKQEYHSSNNHHHTIHTFFLTTKDLGNTRETRDSKASEPTYPARTTTRISTSNNKPAIPPITPEETNVTRKYHTFTERPALTAFNTPYNALTRPPKAPNNTRTTIEDNTITLHTQPPI